MKEIELLNLVTHRALGMYPGKQSVFVPLFTANMISGNDSIIGDGNNKCFFG